MKIEIPTPIQINIYGLYSIVTKGAAFSKCYTLERNKVHNQSTKRAIAAEILLARCLKYYVFSLPCHNTQIFLKEN